MTKNNIELIRNFIEKEQKLLINQVNEIGCFLQW